VSGHDDFQVEPVRGLPEELPGGETLLWQGAPDWRVLARDAFAARTCGYYFAALALWRGWAIWDAGGSGAEIASGVTWLLLLGLVVMGLLSLMAWVAATTTCYTITTRRVVMRIGFLLTLTINLPFRWIGAADLKLNRDGSGNLALSLTGKTRLAYLVLWPNVRPWHMVRAQPALRAIPDAGEVGELLSAAMQADEVRRAAGTPPPPDREGAHRIAAE
jgi:hypothetical protein